MKRLLLALCLWLPLSVSGQEAAERPTIGLVLSGGGAKGMAHVGVLRVLEEMHIPVDVVVGTSAGSAVGALYASGMSVAEIEQRFINMDWLSSFRDDPGRVYKPVRRKQDERRFPVVPGLGIRADGLHVGGGIVAGQNLGFILNELTHSAALVEDFDKLAIPFRAVATDLATGEQVVIGDGSLAEAIRASMSIPGVYAPVERQGRLLVDGGIANNLPISVARSLGADVVIAVDITDPLLDAEKLKEAFSVLGQLTTLLTRRNTDQQLAQLGDRDVLIRPDLQGLTSADFYQAPMLFELAPRRPGSTPSSSVGFRCPGSPGPPTRRNSRPGPTAVARWHGSTLEAVAVWPASSSGSASASGSVRPWMWPGWKPTLSGSMAWVITKPCPTPCRPRRRAPF